MKVDLYLINGGDITGGERIGVVGVEAEEDVGSGSIVEAAGDGRREKGGGGGDGGDGGRGGRAPAKLLGSFGYGVVMIVGINGGAGGGGGGGEAG